MRRESGAWILFWAGLAVAAAFAGIGTLSLMHNLRNLTMAENNATVWATGGALFRLWALSVTLGSLAAGIGAFVYVKTRPVFGWLTGLGVLAAVFLMVMIWTRVYSSAGSTDPPTLRISASSLRARSGSKASPASSNAAKASASITSDHM